MNDAWSATFGPNGDGWDITLKSPGGESARFDFLVEINGPDFYMIAGTVDSRGNLAQFASELDALLKTLSGSVGLDTDYFQLDVVSRSTGHLTFTGSLSAYQFSQYPTGHVRCSFAQNFDPISIEHAIRTLRHCT